MQRDIGLGEVDFVPEAIARRLAELEIHSLRQLHFRLQSEPQALQEFLAVPDEQFKELQTKIDSSIKESFPEDLLPHIYPTVNKRGVPVHRLSDPSRPKYYIREK